LKKTPATHCHKSATLAIVRKEKEKKRKEKKRKEKKSKEKTMPFGVNLMRIQVLYWAAQAGGCNRVALGHNTCLAKNAFSRLFCTLKKKTNTPMFLQVSASIPYLGPIPHRDFFTWTYKAA